MYDAALYPCTVPEFSARAPLPNPWLRARGSMNRLASVARAAAPLASRAMAAAPATAPVATRAAAAEAACAADGAAVCGRGDKRTAKGKRFKHSNGALRGVFRLRLRLP